MAKKNKQLEAIIDIAGSINPSLGKAIEGVSAQLEKVNWKAVAVGAAAAGIAVATGKAVIEAGKYLAQLGADFDNVEDSIRIGTGATGDALDALMDDFDEVYKSVPTTMEDAAFAIADYNTRLDLTGESLQNLSAQAIQVSDLLKEDLAAVVEESSGAFQQWNIDVDDMSDAMDYAFKVSQSTGVGFTDLLSRMQQYGPSLQDMGYSFETASAMIGKMEKAGVNTDEMLAALKKSVATMAKDGVNAADGLAYYYEQIKLTEDAAQAAAIASEIFGARAGPGVAAAIKEGSMAVGDFAAALALSDESINGVAEDTYDLEERMQLFRQNAEVALRPLASTVFDSLNSLIPLVTDAMELIAPVIAELSELLGPLVQELFAGLVPALQEILPPILSLAKSLISKLIPPFMRIVNAILPMIVKLIDSLLPLLDVVIQLLDPIMALVEGLIMPVVDLISTALAPLIDVFTTLIDNILTPLMPLITWLADLFSDVFASSLQSILPFIDNLMEHFRLLGDFFKNVFTGNWSEAWENVKDIFKNAWEALVNITKAPVNAMINGINALLEGLNGITIPDWVPLVGGKSFNIPLIPTFAQGGFTAGPSLAGEAGREAVISFDPTYREQNLSYWARAGQMLGASDGDILGESGRGETVIIYEIDGIHFEPQITVEGNADPDAIVNALRDLAPEFYDIIDEYFERRGAGGYEAAGSWAT